MIVEINGRELNRIFWAICSKISQQREAVAEHPNESTFVENVEELSLIRNKVKKMIGHLQATKWNYGPKGPPRRSLVFLDGNRDWEDSFADYMEEFPFDPSAPAEHFQTEREFDESMEKYRDEREREAFRAGFAAGQASNNKHPSDTGRKITKSGNNTESEVAVD